MADIHRKPPGIEGSTPQLNPAQLMWLAGQYMGMLDKMGIATIPPDDGVRAMRNVPNCRALGHASWMVLQLPELVAAGQLDKANRWLGFIQGTLWCFGVFTVDQLRAHVAHAQAPAPWDGEQ